MVVIHFEIYFFHVKAAMNATNAAKNTSTSLSATRRTVSVNFTKLSNACMSSSFSTLKWTAEKPSYNAAFCAAGCTPSSKSTNCSELGIVRACLSDDEMGWEAP